MNPEDFMSLNDLWRFLVAPTHGGYLGEIPVRPKLEPWDPAPTTPCDTIDGVDLPAEEQESIVGAANLQHAGAEVAAEWARKRAGYGGHFNRYGDIT